MEQEYQTFYANCMALARSIVIKSTDLAIDMNQALSYIGYTSDDSHPETWRYYLNLNGEYHASNQPMTVTSLDTLEEIAFTKEQLVTHRATEKAYRDNAIYRNQLRARYPLNGELIKGILNPVDIDTAMRVKDYTILSYDSRYVGSQEDSLMNELQQWIYRFFNKYYVKNYSLTDELFHQFKHLICALQMANEIHSIRLKYAMTREAHRFHIWNHLGSHFYLDDFKGLLNTDQMLLLYRNINWLVANAGTEKAQTKLIDIVMTLRQFPITEFTLRQDKSSIIDDLLPTPDLIREQVNLRTNTGTNDLVRTPRHVLEQELSLAPLNEEDLLDDERTINRNMAKSMISRQLTKAMESAMVDLSGSELIDLDDVLLYHWMYFSFGPVKRYTPIITVTDPQTTDVFNITVSDAFTLWFYLMNKQRGVTLTDIPELRALSVVNNVPTPYPTFDDLRKRAPRRLVSDLYITNLMGAASYSVGMMVNTESFYDTCEEIYLTKKRHYMAYSNINHKMGHGFIKSLCERYYQDYQLNPSNGYTTFLELFAALNVDFTNIEEGQALTLATELYRRSLGLDLRTTRTLADIQAAMINIMRRLGAYSTQYIRTINTGEVINLGVIPPRINDPDVTGKSDIFLPVNTNVLSAPGHGVLTIRAMMEYAKVRSYKVKGNAAVSLGNSPHFRVTCRPTFKVAIRGVAPRLLSVTDNLND